MKIDKIYFDMDGVLAEFSKGVEKLCQMQAVDQNSNTEEYDEMLFERMRQIEHFYAKLDINPEAEELFRKVREKYGEKVEILSGIPKPERGIEHAGEDKIEWIHEKLGEDIVVNIVLRKDKVNFCKGPGYILIDDFIKNIKEWEKCGGTGIRYTDPKCVWDILK